MTTLSAPLPDVPRLTFDSESLQRETERVLQAIPAERSGQVVASVTTEGMRIEAAHRFSRHGSIAGYAERQWGGRGWAAGAQARIAW